MSESKEKQTVPVIAEDFGINRNKEGFNNLSSYEKIQFVEKRIKDAEVIAKKEAAKLNVLKDALKLKGEQLANEAIKEANDTLKKFEDAGIEDLTLIKSVQDRIKQCEKLIPKPEEKKDKEETENKESTDKQ